MSYSSEVLADSPLAYWRLTESSGYTFQDATANNNDFTTSGTAVHLYAQTDSPIASDSAARSFDVNQADQGLVTITAIDPTVAHFTTVEFWCKIGSYGLVPFTFDNAYAHLCLWAYSSTAFGFNTGNGDVYGTSTGPQAGSWAHVVACCYSGDYLQNKIYVNGVSKSMSQLIGSPQIADAHLTADALVWFDLPGGGYSIPGWDMAELAIYDGELSASRIQAHYDAAPMPPITNAPETLRVLSSGARWC